MKTRVIVLSMALLLLAIPALAATPADQTYLSVKETGAVGDGKADDTAAFEAAIIKAKEKGITVRVPQGTYKITRTLTLDAQGMVGADNAAWTADAVTLPTILPEVKSGPCVRLKGGGSVHGMRFNYDWAGKEPSPIGATIELAGVGCRVSDVKIHNAWDGIMADGRNNVGRCQIEHCFIVDAHNVGVRVTGTWDVSWVSKVEVWAPASKNFPAKGVGFQFGKNDVLLVSDCLTFRASVGYQLLDEIPGCEIKGGTWGSFANCSADLCSFGVEVNGKHTISIAGGMHWTHFGGLSVKGKGAQVRVSGLEFAANGGPALDVSGGELVTVTGCQLRRTHAGFKVPAVRITGGEAAVVTGCVITSTSRGVEVKEGLANVVLANNVVKENVKE